MPTACAGAAYDAGLGPTSSVLLAAFETLENAFGVTLFAHLVCSFRLSADGQSGVLVHGVVAEVAGPTRPSEVPGDTKGATFDPAFLVIGPP